MLYSAEIPTGASLFQFLVVPVVGAARFCALGFAITTVIPNADAAAPIVNATPAKVRGRSPGRWAHGQK